MLQQQITVFHLLIVLLLCLQNVASQCLLGGLLIPCTTTAGPTIPPAVCDAQAALSCPSNCLPHLLEADSRLITTCSPINSLLSAGKLQCTTTCGSLPILLSANATQTGAVGGLLNLLGNVLAPLTQLFTGGFASTCIPGVGFISLSNVLPAKAPFNLMCVGPNQGNMNTNPLQNPFTPQNYPQIANIPTNNLGALFSFGLKKVPILSTADVLIQNVTASITNILLLALTDLSMNRLTVSVTPNSTLTSVLDLAISVSISPPIQGNGGLFSIVAGISVAGLNVGAVVDLPTVSALLGGLLQVVSPSSGLRSGPYGGFVDPNSFTVAFFSFFELLLGAITFTDAIIISATVFGSCFVFTIISHYRWPQAQNARLFLLLVSLYNFATHLYLAYFLYQYYIMTNSQMQWLILYYVVLLLIAVKLLFDLIAYPVLLFQEEAKNPALKDFMEKHRFLSLMMFPFIIIDIENAFFLASRMFHLPRLSAPFSAAFFYRLKVAGFAMTLATGATLEALTLYIGIVGLSQMQGTALFLLVANGLAMVIRIMVNAMPYLLGMGEEHLEKQLAKRETVQHRCPSFLNCFEPFCAPAPSSSSVPSPTAASSVEDRGGGYPGEPMKLQVDGSFRTPMAQLNSPTRSYAMNGSRMSEVQPRESLVVIDAMDEKTEEQLRLESRRQTEIQMSILPPSRPQRLLTRMSTAPSVASSLPPSPRPSPRASPRGDPYLSPSPRNAKVSVASPPPVPYSPPPASLAPSMPLSESDAAMAMQVVPRISMNALMDNSVRSSRASFRPDAVEFRNVPVRFSEDRQR